MAVDGRSGGNKDELQAAEEEARRIREAEEDAAFEEALGDLPEELRAVFKKRQTDLEQRAAKRQVAAAGGGEAEKLLECQFAQVQEAALAFGKLVASSSAGAWRSGPYHG